MSKRKKPPIAPAPEVLEVLTSVMRGEITEMSTRKVAGVEETVALPPKIVERLKAAEYLGKQYGLFERREDETTPKTGIVIEIRQRMEEMHAAFAKRSA